MDIEQARKLAQDRWKSVAYRDFVLADYFYDGMVLKEDSISESLVPRPFDFDQIDSLKEELFEYLIYNPLERQVRKKTNYLIARPYTVVGSEEVKEFWSGSKKLLKETLIELYKKGEVWWEFIPDNESSLKFKISVRKAQSIAPHYTNEERTEYDAVGYIWNRVCKDGKIIRYIDVVDMQGRHRYPLQNTTELESEDLSHAKKNGEAHNFKSLPFIRIEEIGLYQLIRFLGRMYSTRYKQADSLVEDNADPIAVVKNASGTDSEELIQEIHDNKIVKVQGDGDFNYASKSMDYSSIENFMKVLKSDIADLCGTVSREQELQYITSGRALDRLYVDMDSDAAETGDILRDAIRQFLTFVGDETGKDLLKGFDIVFNSDKPTDEQQIISNINSSASLLSEETLLEQHPWVKDVDEEKKRKEKEAKSKEPEPQNIDEEESSSEQVEEEEVDKETIKKEVKKEDDI